MGLTRDGCGAHPNLHAYIVDAVQTRPIAVQLSGMLPTVSASHLDEIATAQIE